MCKFHTVVKLEPHKEILPSNIATMRTAKEKGKNSD
jgi:hypothetical protein